MTEPTIKGADDLTTRMCRESDAAGGPTAWMMHLLVLCVLIAAVAWTMLGIRDLRDASDRCESELLEFRELAAKAARSPRRDMARVSAEFTRRITAQSWHKTLDGIRPRVLQTPAGLRVRFARTIPDFRGASNGTGSDR
jgi:hypothetical protein